MRLCFAYHTPEIKCRQKDGSQRRHYRVTDRQGTRRAEVVFVVNNPWGGRIIRGKRGAVFFSVPPARRAADLRRPKPKGQTATRWSSFPLSILPSTPPPYNQMPLQAARSLAARQTRAKTDDWRKAVPISTFLLAQHGSCRQSKRPGRLAWALFLSAAAALACLPPSPSVFEFKHKLHVLSL